MGHAIHSGLPGMRLAVFFFFFLLTPASLAFDCNLLKEDERGFCEEINKLELTNEEKDMLMMDLIYNGKEFPDHDFVYYWNANLQIGQPPEDVTTQDKGYIKNAWLKILTVMPSIIEDDKLYCSGQGKVLTRYDYYVKIPTETMSGDCKTEYELVQETSKLNVYLNDKLIGNEQITPFTTDEDAEFKAALDIIVQTKIKRYEWREYCCETNKNCYTQCTYKKGKKTCTKVCKNECVRYCKTCELRTTETKEDLLTLIDTFKASYYGQKPETVFKITDQYYDITEGFLNATNFTSLTLSFKDSFYQNNKYYYGLSYSFKPYYILTLRANKHLTENSKNIHVTNNDPEYKFAVENPQDCNIKISDHFQTYEQKCDTAFNKTKIILETDKLSYKEGETIKVNVTPKDKQIRLSYGSESVNAYAVAEFTAQPYDNKITAELGDAEANKIIYVSNSSNWKLIKYLLLFLTIIYLIVKLFNAKWRFL
jgi:hypothetical protein